MGAVLGIPVFYYTLTLGTNGLAGNDEVTAYFEKFPQSSKQPSTEKDFNEEAVRLSSYLYKNIPTGMSEQNKNLVILISNDLLFLSGKDINDKTLGISTFAKTCPVVSSIYKYVLSLPVDTQQSLSGYLEGITPQKNIFSMTQDDFIAIADKIKATAPEAFKNKFTSFSDAYRSAVLNPPKYYKNDNKLIVLSVIALIAFILILIVYFFPTIKAKFSKAGFGRRR